MPRKLENEETDILDTEGHKKKLAEDEDDTEGHKFGRHLGETEDDVEGHQKK
jgi:hypothetical protein